MQQQKAFACKSCNFAFAESSEVVEHFRRAHQAKTCRACGCTTSTEFCDLCTKEHPTEISSLLLIEDEIRQEKAKLKTLLAHQNSLLETFVKKHPQGRISIYCEHGDVRETCARCAKVFDILDAKRDERIRQRKASEAEALNSDVKPLTRMQKAKFVHL